jgi:hypothetical protein
MGSKYLRWIMGQCARANMRAELEGTIAKFHGRVKRRMGDQRAIVAAAAKMLGIVYWVLKEKRAYCS